MIYDHREERSKLLVFTEVCDVYKGLLVWWRVTLRDRTEVNGQDLEPTQPSPQVLKVLFQNRSNLYEVRLLRLLGVGWSCFGW